MQAYQFKVVRKSQQQQNDSKMAYLNKWVAAYNGEYFICKSPDHLWSNIHNFQFWYLRNVNVIAKSHYLLLNGTYFISKSVLLYITMSGKHSLLHFTESRGIKPSTSYDIAELLSMHMNQLLIQFKHVKSNLLKLSLDTAETLKPIIVKFFHF